MLIIIGATTGNLKANDTAIKEIKRSARGYRNAANYESVILLRSSVRTGGMTLIQGIHFPTDREEPAISGPQQPRLPLTVVAASSCGLGGESGQVEAILSRCAWAECQHGTNEIQLDDIVSYELN